MWDVAAQQRAMRYAAAETADVSEAGQAVAMGPDTHFPVPPMDLPHYHGVGLAGGTGLEAGVSNTETSSREVTGA
jgi:hypothetical protein